MGTWSTDAFGNDDAADWVHELEEAKDLGPIGDAVDAVLSVGDEYLEAPEASIALAAVEVLARLSGSPGEKNSYTEVADKWVEGMQLKPSVALLDKARAVLVRILAEDSELKELWEDSDEYDSWLASVEDLRGRLGT